MRYGEGLHESWCDGTKGCGGSGCADPRPTTSIRLVRGVHGMFPRITLWCPEGHEVVDAPLSSGLGQRLNVGNYAGESCGYGKCGWSA